MCERVSTHSTDSTTSLSIVEHISTPAPRILTWRSRRSRPRQVNAALYLSPSPSSSSLFSLHFSALFSPFISPDRRRDFVPKSLSIAGGRSNFSPPDTLLHSMVECPPCTISVYYVPPFVYSFVASPPCCHSVASGERKRQPVPLPPAFSAPLSAADGLDRIPDEQSGMAQNTQAAVFREIMTGTCVCMYVYVCKMSRCTSPLLLL